MEFKRRTLSVKVNDVAYDVKYPVSGQVRKYQLDVKDAGDEKSFDIMIDFLHELGLPKEVSLNQMEIHDIVSILSELIVQKKS
jgi:hypothetical protein